MSDAILNEDIIVESEPITPDELIAHLIQDLLADSSPDDLAAEFIDEFVLQERAETAQILSLLDIPSEALADFLKGVVGQSYQQSVEAIDARGVHFLDSLKVAVRDRMTQMAE